MKTRRSGIKCGQRFRLRGLVAAAIRAAAELPIFMKIPLSFALALALSGVALQVVPPPAQAAPSAETPAQRAAINAAYAKIYAGETPAQRTGREAITAAYVKIDTALAKGNLAAVIPYFAPNYSARDADGKVSSRAQSVARLRKPSGLSVRLPKIRHHIARPVHRGKDILATNQLTATGKARMGTVTVPIKIISHWRDLWALTPRGWKIHQRVTTRSETWVNGKRRL